MELNKINRVYFIGVGGIGMSAIARYFLHRNSTVFGYDRTKTKLTEALESEGVSISYEDDEIGVPVEFLKGSDEALVVFTPAIPQDSKIIQYFKNNKVQLFKRSEVLGIISKGQFCIAVAGTHGKTTTSSIVAHLLTATGHGCTAFLGGIATNYGSNFLLGDDGVVVVEADEYDRSFLTLHPDIAVITSMDADHLDIYGNATELEQSFEQFAAQLKPKGTLFVKNGLPVSGITYSAGMEGSIGAINIRVENSKFVFDYFEEGFQISDLKLQLPGKHNVENAVAAIAVALKLGISVDRIKDAVSTFKGVKRRFEYIVKNAKHVYIDDYAHHPKELEACFHAIRQLYPGEKLTVIFQPHLFSRTRDFAADFAEVLGTADELLLLEIYPARELPIEGIDSRFLLDQILLDDKQICSKEQVLSEIERKQPKLLLTVGAGDIDTLIQPLKMLLDHD